MALVSCGMLVDVQGAFPGWIALWPLFAAALVLLAGSTGHQLSVDRLLSARPAPRCLPAARRSVRCGSPAGAVIVPLGLNSLVCPQQECRPVVGKVMVFIDAGHTSGTYAASMQEAVDKQLTDSGFRW
ncbi:hypothetical protein [Brachybacterium sp. p3-SID957]|uniref:hypothetical protein n=1 Tax=Brachybacterium sp. p3-SID957 TaxID=2916049 RepID=UPI00223B0D86|nr:hypothetical protein [Brachybacterium sp. p3-SID957]